MKRQLAATDEPESSAGADVYEDLNQLHFEGLAPPPPERLPISTPTPQATIAVSTTPSNPTPSIPTPTTAAAPRRQSRIAMYVIAVAIVILVVAGVAYVMGRSAQTPNAPTEQLP